MYQQQLLPAYIFDEEEDAALEVEDGRRAQPEDRGDEVSLISGSDRRVDVNMREFEDVFESPCALFTTIWCAWQPFSGAFTPRPWLGLNAIDEFKSHLDNKTMWFEELPDGVVPINAMYIYSVKHLAEGFPGSNEKKKARLVAKGCSQIPGVYFGETFAPTLNPVTFRLMLSIAIQHDLFLS